MGAATPIGVMVVPAVAVGCAEPIEVTGGRISGDLTVDGEIAIWRGIPYAASPTGELRWRPPQPVEP